MAKTPSSTPASSTPPPNPDSRRSSTPSKRKLDVSLAAPPRQSGWESWGPAAFLALLGVVAALLTLFVSLRLLAALVAGFALLFGLAVRRFSVGRKNTEQPATNRALAGGLALNAVVVVAAAALALFGPAPPRSTEKLVQALKSPKTDVRQNAAVQLGKLGQTGAVALADLMEALQDPEPSVRSAAATALGAIGPRARLAHFNLLQATSDADAAVAQAARAALALVGTPAPDEIGDLLAEASGAERARCAIGLWQQALRSRRPELRRDAALSLGMKGQLASVAVADLLEALEDSDGGVRIAVATALGKIGAPARLAFFDLMVSSADVDEAFTRAAQEAAGNIGRPSPIDVDDFHAALTHSSARLRAAAAKGLWLIGPASLKAKAGLERALKDDNVWVRVWSAQALCTLQPEPAKLLPVLKQSLSHSNPEVRKVTVLVLQQLRPSAEDALAPLLTQLGREKDAIIAVPIIETIAAMGPAAGKASPALIRALERSKKDDVPIRRAAAFALFQVQGSRQETLDALTKALADRDASVCEMAVLSLSCFGPAARATALDELRKALRHSEPRVRGLTVDALAAIEARDDKTIEALRQTLLAAHADDRKTKSDAKKTDKEAFAQMVSAEICFKACMVFATFGSAARPATSDLCKVLDHSHPQVRAKAIVALFQIGIESKDAQTLAALTNALADADDEVCLQAIKALQSCGPDAKDAVPALVRVLDGRAAPLLRTEAALALSKIGVEARAAVPALIDALGDPDQRVRLQAATVFAQAFRNEGRTFPRRSMVPALAGMLAGPGGPLPATISLAPESLGAGLALCNILRDADPNLRVVAAYALANIMEETPFVAEELARVLLEDRDIRVREGAASALRVLRPRNKVVVKALAQALLQDRKSREVRLAAAQALAAIADRDALPALETASRDDLDADVKAAAEQALKLLNNRKS